MLAELKLELPPPGAAAGLLARIRVERIQSSGEDPLLSTGYFHQLWQQSDYFPELAELGNLDDYFPWNDEATVRALASRAMEALRNPIKTNDPDQRLAVPLHFLVKPPTHLSHSQE